MITCVATLALVTSAIHEASATSPVRLYRPQAVTVGDVIVVSVGGPEYAEDIVQAYGGTTGRLLWNRRMQMCRYDSGRRLVAGHDAVLVHGMFLDDREPAWHVLNIDTGKTIASITARRGPGWRRIHTPIVSDRWMITETNRVIDRWLGVATIDLPSDANVDGIIDGDTLHVLGSKSDFHTPSYIYYRFDLVTGEALTTAEIGEVDFGFPHMFKLLDVAGPWLLIQPADWDRSPMRVDTRTLAVTEVDDAVGDRKPFLVPGFEFTRITPFDIAEIDAADGSVSFRLHPHVAALGLDAEDTTFILSDSSNTHVAGVTGRALSRLVVARRDTGELVIDRPVNTLRAATWDIAIDGSFVAVVRSVKKASEDTVLQVHPLQVDWKPIRIELIRDTESDRRFGPVRSDTVMWGAVWGGIGVLIVIALLAWRRIRRQSALSSTP